VKADVRIARSAGLSKMRCVLLAIFGRTISPSALILKHTVA
jgi:hypothetical protein